ncbi:MAG: carboxypeptidase regulatory-like domain-containing protein, partial [Bryobacteraceae bacterium]
MKSTNITLLVFLLACGPSFSQSTTGVIVGLVRDPNTALVPGAKVTARNAGTRAESHTTTDGEGYYRFSNLAPGDYFVEVEASGFRKSTISPQNLGTSGSLRLDVTLEIGSVTEVVVVEATATAVNTEDAQLGRSIRDQVGLPVLSGNGGRNVLSLAGIQPGVVFAGQLSGQQAGVFSANGQRAQANNYMLDGADSNDLAINVPDMVQGISPNAVTEFRLVTGAMKAEFGRNSGAIVMVTPKSGTNNWHGGASETFRNTKLNAVPFFQKSVTGGTTELFSSGLKRKPQWNSNDFDANFGGRVVRDKTFFYVSYLGFRRRQGVANSATVPS